MTCSRFIISILPASPPLLFDLFTLQLMWIRYFSDHVNDIGKKAYLMCLFVYLTTVYPYFNQCEKKVKYLSLSLSLCMYVCASYTCVSIQINNDTYKVYTSVKKLCNQPIFFICLEMWYLTTTMEPLINELNIEMLGKLFSFSTCW